MKTTITLIAIFSNIFISGLAQKKKPPVDSTKEKWIPKIKYTGHKPEATIGPFRSLRLPEPDSIGTRRVEGDESFVTRLVKGIEIVSRSKTFFKLKCFTGLDTAYASCWNKNIWIENKPSILLNTKKEKGSTILIQETEGRITIGKNNNSWNFRIGPYCSGSDSGYVNYDKNSFGLIYNDFDTLIVEPMVDDFHFENRRSYNDLYQMKIGKKNGGYLAAMNIGSNKEIWIQKNTNDEYRLLIVTVFSAIFF